MEKAIILWKKDIIARIRVERIRQKFISLSRKNFLRFSLFAFLLIALLIFGLTGILGKAMGLGIPT